MSFFGSRFREEMAQSGSVFWNLSASAVLDILRAATNEAFPCTVVASKAATEIEPQRHGGHREKQGGLSCLCVLCVLCGSTIKSAGYARRKYIYPEELMDKVKGTYDGGLVSHGVVGYKHFRKALEEESVETSLQRVREELQRRSLDDLHRSMSWWACFEHEDEDSSFRSSVAANVSPKQSQRKKATKKKKKMAKASRKKNRR